VAGLSAAALLLGWLVSPVRAQEKMADNPNLAPKATAVMKQMGKCLAAARQFSFEARDMVDYVLDDGQKIQISLGQKICVRRPDRVYAEAKGDLEDAQYWYDGRQLSMFDRAENRYATLEVPSTIDEMFDFLAAEYGMTFPLCDLVFSDPYNAVMPRVRTGMYVGLHQVDGVPCHHLAFRQEGVDWQIWIQESDPPVPRKLVISYTELPGDPQYIAFLDDWNLNATVPDAKFRFTPPPGAEKTELTPGRKRPEPQAETPLKKSP
jgi:hypothetical protein